jgi:hypothetical protein
MKISELSGAALDWAVAKCEDEEVSLIKGQLETRWTDNGWKPSTDWAQGGPIFEREKLGLGHVISEGNSYWIATGYLVEECAPTPLIAAMRCYVASKLGDEVDVPDELTEETA